MKLTRANKTKFIARVMLIILLLTSALNFSGCGDNPQYVFFCNDDWTGSPRCWLMNNGHVFVETNQFSDDCDIPINLSFAMHKLNVFGAVSSDPKHHLLHSVYYEREFLMGIYLCKELQNGEYERLMIKQIEDEELFSQKYGWIDTPWFINNGVTYMHSEKIIIPNNYFCKDYGTVLLELKLSSFDENTYWDNTVTYTFYLRYEKKDGSIVFSGGELI